MTEPWSESLENIFYSLNTEPGTGLSRAEAKKRLDQFGANRLTIQRAVSFWGVFKEEIEEPMIVLV